MKTTSFLIITALTVFLALPAAHAQLSWNRPNGTCYLQDGSQYYLRAYSGQKMVDELAVCDEKLKQDDWEFPFKGHVFYMGNYGQKWVWEKHKKSGNTIYLFRINKQTQAWENIGLFYSPGQ
jgi:hypothetical protein